MQVAEIKSKIRARGVGEINETKIDFKQRAAKAIEDAEAAIARAEGNTTEVADGRTTAAKNQAENSIKISQNIVVGTFKKDVNEAEEDVKARGLAKIKGEIDVEAGKHGVKIARKRQ